MYRSCSSLHGQQPFSRFRADLESSSHLADIFLFVVSAEVAIWIVLAARPVVGFASASRERECGPLNFCLAENNHMSACCWHHLGGEGGKGAVPIELGVPYRMLANSLLMRFSSNSRALAFLRSAMNWTRPRMLALLELERPRKPAAADDMVGWWDRGEMGDIRLDGRADPCSMRGSCYP